MPEKAYQVNLELFEGPLDLLLFLVKKDDLDIHNIPIAHITREYLAYLDLLKEFNLDIAGEFLVMAATLMAYKSRALLPSQEVLNEDEGPNPAAELAQKLLEYQKFKEASKFLMGRADEMSNVYFRGAPHFEEADKSPNLSLFELMEHIKVILEEAEDDSREVAGEEFPIEEKIEKILFLLSNVSVIAWEELFADERKRRGIIACFLAMLELTKLQKIFIRQDANFGKIRIFKKENAADEETPVVEDLGSAPEPGPAVEPGPVAEPGPVVEPGPEPGAAVEPGPDDDGERGDGEPGDDAEPGEPDVQPGS